MTGFLIIIASFTMLTLLILKLPDIFRWIVEIIRAEKDKK